MAPPRQDSFELFDYLGVLRRRWWIVVVLIIVGVGIAAAYAKAAPKTYTSSALVQVSVLPNNANQAAGRTSGSVNMDNEAQIVQSVTVASLAAERIHSPLSPPDLVKQISVSVPPNTTFLQISCGAPTPGGAAACANAFADAYLTNRHNTIVSSVSGQLKANSTRIRTLSSRVANLKAHLTSLPRNAPSRTSVLLSVQADDALLSQLETDDNALVPLLDGLNLPNNTAAGRVVTPATRPTSPSSPRKLLLLPSGLLAGLLIGLLWAFLADRRDQRIHTPRDVERFLNVPVLLTVAGRKGGPAAGLMPGRSRDGQAFAEVAQYVAASLGEDGRVLLVTGTSTGPGCSTVAANLAATLARTRSEVVLVCADPQTTVTPQLLGIGEVRGLAEVLAGTATAAEVAGQPADMPRLQVITPGIDTSNALFNLQAAGSRRLLAELREDSRYVIIEAQSVGAYADSFMLAEFADAAIVVVETEFTRRPDAADCLNWLDRLHTPVLGAAVLPAPQRKTAAPQPAQPPSRPAASARPAPSSRSGPAARPAARPADRPADRARPDLMPERGQVPRMPSETWPLPRAAAMGLPDRPRRQAEFNNPPDKSAGV